MIPRSRRRTAHRSTRVPLGLQWLEGRIAPASLISLVDASVAEGDDGESPTLEFGVARSGDLNPQVTVSYHTEDGSARSGVDYAASSGTVVIPAGSTSATISIPIEGNQVLQPGRDFRVVLDEVLDVTLLPGRLGVTPTFAVEHSFATGSFPTAVATGDLNGDGRPDLVVANTSSSTLSVFLNTTAPGATAPTFDAATVATGTGPKSVSIADLNGDGRPDLAITSYGEDGVSILLNTADPGSPAASFATPRSFSTGPDVVRPRSLAVGDLNGDGRPDLAVVGRASGSVAVLFNETAPGADAPSFSARVAFPVGPSNRSVAIGDIDGDGRPDLAVTNYDADSLSVLLNTGEFGAATPSFADQATFVTGAKPYAVAIGDLNGDGRPDLAVANYRSKFLSLLLNRTAPGAAAPDLAPQQQVAIGRSGPLSIVIGDFDGDGKPDLATANFFQANATVLANATPTGSDAFSFGRPLALPVGSSPYSVALADLDGDGRPDLAVTNARSDNLSILLNTTAPSAVILTTPDPTFAGPQSISDLPFPRFPTIADLNGDGRPDVVVTNFLEDSVSVLLNAAAPGSSTTSFAPAVSFPTGSYPSVAKVGDLDGDGRPDLVVADLASNTLTVLRNTTPTGSLTPSFAARQSFPSAANVSSRSLSVADVNGDGRPDLLFTNYELQSAVSVLLNTTAPGSDAVTFDDATSFPVGTAPNWVEIADFNGDGRPDLVFIRRFTYYGVQQGVSVLLNTTTPSATTPDFADPVLIPTGPSMGLAVTDVNGDGRPDLALSNYGDDERVAVLLNLTAVGAETPSFDPERGFPSGPFPLSLTSGDIDGDGRPDLIVTTSSDSPLSVLLNTTAAGASTPDFAPRLAYPRGFPSSPAVADVNGDGRPDLVFADYNDGGVSVWLNTTSGNVSNNPSIATGTILDDDAPASIGPASGDGQTTLIGTDFQTDLSVIVRNARGRAVQGAGVTFSAPTSGASALFGGSGVSITVLTDADGRATAPSLIANVVVGSYQATAQVEGLAATAAFRLGNVTSVDSTRTAVGFGSRTQLVAGRSNLPWANISRIVITFDSAVAPTTADLTVAGLGGRTYPVTGVAVVGNTVTWTLGTPIGEEDVISVAVNPLLADYTAQLSVLPGDVNDDGIVNGRDLVIVRNAFTGLGPPATIPLDFLDLDGDGVVDLLDYNIVRRFMGRRPR
jgi:hypothetical protein